MDTECEDYDYDYEGDTLAFQQDVFNKSKQHKDNYTVLKKADIRQRVKDDIDSVSSFLSIQKQAARILLLNYRWNSSTVEEAWFSDEDKVRKSLRLFIEKPVMKPSYATDWIKCIICYEEKCLGQFCSTTCGHLFCVTCWKRYMEISISKGPGCLMLRCPEPMCCSVVTQDMIDHLVSDSHKEKFDRFLIRSYVEDGNGKIKWCPVPGCKYAVEFERVGTCDYDVMCGCLNGFCWNCLEESHQPVDCETVAKWMTKGKAEAENTTWILAYTKQCPKCKRSIEKVSGCMHMICDSHCRFEFCWLCLRPWVEHKDYYDCNWYKEANDKIEETREMAKNSLIKYTHYYERWVNNDKSWRYALRDLYETNLDNLKKLYYSNLSKTVAELEFIVEAWVQIVECRRVLKWTYAYGYYIPEEELAKKQLFEYLQGEAEAALERHHYCAETELGCYLKDTEEKFADTKDTDSKVADKKDADMKDADKIDVDKLSADFDNYRIKLKDLTSVTKIYFENLVKAIEDGLQDVNSTKV